MDDDKCAPGDQRQSLAIVTHVFRPHPSAAAAEYEAAFRLTDAEFEYIRIVVPDGKE